MFNNKSLKNEYCFIFVANILLMKIDFETLKNTVQSIIDCLAKKDREGAVLQLKKAKEMLNEMTDFAITDTDLIELSRYQILLSHLEQKV